LVALLPSVTPQRAARLCPANTAVFLPLFHLIPLLHLQTPSSASLSARDTSQRIAGTLWYLHKKQRCCLLSSSDLQHAFNLLSSLSPYFFAHTRTLRRPRQVSDEANPQPLLQPGAHPELAFLAFFLAFLLSSRPTSTVTTSTASYSASRRRLQHLASPPLRALARQRSSELSHCRSSFPPTSQDATLGRSPICSSTTPTFREPDPVLFQHPPVFPAPSFRQERRCGRLLRPPLRLPSVSELSTSAEHFQHRRPVHLSASALVFSLLVVDEVVCFHLLSSPSHCSVETADQLVAKERQWERLGCDSFVSHHWRPKEVGKRSEER
jgi:hypothetical protein